MNRVRILGIGSPSGDDQAGWLTVDALLALGVGAHAELLKLDRPGAGLIALLENADHVVVVDAMLGMPGAILRCDENDWAGYRQGLSSHGFGVQDALTLAQALGSLPLRLELYGIGIAAADPGAAPGARVRTAARALAERIAADLETRPRGPRAAA